MTIKERVKRDFCDDLKDIIHLLFQCCVLLKNLYFRNTKTTFHCLCTVPTVLHSLKLVLAGKETQ